MAAPPIFSFDKDIKQKSFGKVKFKVRNENFEINRLQKEMELILRSNEQEGVKESDERLKIVKEKIRQQLLDKQSTQITKETNEIILLGGEVGDGENFNYICD